MVCRWQRTFTATEASSWIASSESISAGVAVTITPNSFSLGKGEQITLSFSSEITADFDEDYGMARAILTPSNNNLAISSLPMVGKYIPGDFDDDIVITAHTDEGSVLVRGIQTIGTNDLQVQVSALGEIVTRDISVLRDGDDDAAWPSNIYNNVNAYYLELIEIPQNTLYVEVKINSTSSPDLDLYVGLDSDGDGQLNNAELRNANFQAATSKAVERCEIVNPTSGDYYIAVHNYGVENATSQVSDNVVFEWVVVTENDGQLTVDYDSRALSKENIDLSLNWVGPFIKQIKVFLR